MAQQAGAGQAAAAAPAASGAPKRRQARGERRMAELLEAAGQVFAASGYSATTTNAIAARAGVSPGTLYQYFSNKDAIADALAEYYTDRLQQVIDDVLGAGVTGLPLEELLDRVLDPLVAFYLRNPSCTVLFMGPDSPQRLTDHHLPLHAAMLSRVAGLLAVLAPELPADQLARSAEVVVYLFKGVLPLILAAAPEDRPGYTVELKRAFVGYFGLLRAPN